ncbi:MAG: hypothetical protein J5594_05630 [Elusimicrobiaceae bacterium]|nr:hypothetical protein [Elusimicrobiaceae bacterium]
MPFIKNKFLKRIICLGLSVALIYNATVPALGQEFFYTPEVPSMTIDQTNFDHTRAEVHALIIDDIRETHNKNMQDSGFARAEEIKSTIMGNPGEEVAKEIYEGPIDYKAKFLEDLEDNYTSTKTALENQHRDFLEQIEKERKKYRTQGLSEAEIAERTTKELQNVEEKFQEEMQRVNTYHDEQLDKVNNHYEDFLKELQQGYEESLYMQVRNLFAELMKIYQANPNNAKEQILEVTPIIVSLVNSKGVRIYNQEQKKILLDLYRKVVEEENSKLGKEKDPRVNPCEIKGYCTNLTNAIMGIGVLSPRYKDADLIMKTIKNYEDTSAYVPVMLSGMAALLAMEQYDAVDKFLEKSTIDENRTMLWEYLDYLNFMNIPLAVAKTNGKYLGKVSQKVEYSTGKQFQNAYFDLAQMLAEEGSDNALNILRKYSVEKCGVQQTSGVQKGTLTKYAISCSGIMPFLVGALLSGKSGADKYPTVSQAKQYIDANGNVHNTDYEGNAYYNLAKDSFNGDAEAMLAFYVMNEGMGDLNTADEYNLDISLYKAFKKRIPEKFLSSKRIVIDEERKAQKESRRTVLASFVGLGLAADIVITIVFVRDILNGGIKLIGFGKNLFKAVKLAKIGLTAKNIPALAKFAANYTKAAFMRQRFVIKITNMGKNFKTFTKNYKSAVRLSVLKNSIQYTNEVHRQVEGSLGVLAKGERTGLTRGITKILRGIKYNKDLGIFVLPQVGAKTPKQLVEIVHDIVNTAMSNAKTKYRVGKLFKKGVNFKDLFFEEIKELIASSPLGIKDKEFLINFLKSDDFGRVLAQADSHISSLGTKTKTVRNFAENPLVLSVFAGAEEQKGQRVGAEFIIGDKMPAFSEELPKYVSVVKENGSFIIKFFKNENEALDLSAFKLAFENTDSFADFARASAALGDAGKIELKFIPKEANTFWSRNFRNVFAGNKEKLFAGRGKVFILGKDGKTLTETGITLKTYKQYDGLRIIIDENVGLIVRKGKDIINVTTEGAFFLPKYAIGDFLNLAKLRELDTPYKIKLLGGMNKVNALYLQSMVSLSVASTGLVRPLSKNYPEEDLGKLTFISLIFPYLLSAATPFVSPFVKKFGAIKMLKTSMYLSLASLSLPIMAGFNGFNGIQADNPFDKPSPALLYPSALLIGLATTLTRGSYSPLIQAIGGGSGTLKAVAFKSISSFMLILPPAAGALFDHINPKLFLNPDGSVYLDENGQPVKKHWFDFSFSYPVLLAISGAALYKLQKAHFNPSIGKSANSFKNAGEFFNDVKASYKLLGRKDLLPLTLSSALLAGAESSLLYAYSNSMASEYVANKIHEESLVPIIALLGLNLPAFVTRMNSKSILRAFGGDSLAGYRNLLTLGVASAGAGSYLLATQDDPLTFSLGLALTSIGFSQVTSSILRYGHKKLELELVNPADKRFVTSWDVSYPTVFIGMSAIPFLYGKMADKNIESLETENKNDMVSLKNTSWQEMMGIPIAALALGGGLSYLGMRPKNALGAIKAGHLIAPLGLVAESHNPAFTTLALPKPSFAQPKIMQPKPSTFEPHFEYNPELLPPDTLKVTPNFSIQPLTH